MPAENVLVAPHRGKPVQVGDVLDDTVGAVRQRVSPVAHDLQKVEIVGLDVAHVGLDGLWPPNGIGAKVVPERHGQTIGLGARKNGRNTLDLVHHLSPNCPRRASSCLESSSICFFNSALDSGEASLQASAFCSASRRDERFFMLRLAISIPAALGAAGAVSSGCGTAGAGIAGWVCGTAGNGDRRSGNHRLWLRDRRNGNPQPRRKRGNSVVRQQDPSCPHDDSVAGLSFHVLLIEVVAGREFLQLLDVLRFVLLGDLLAVLLLGKLDLDALGGVVYDLHGLAIVRRR